jgi:CHAT domain-containing protein
LFIKNATTRLSVSIVMLLMLIAAALNASGQNGLEKITPQSSGSERRAAELFEEALAFSRTKERDLGRARLSEAVRLWVQMRESDKAARACLQMGDSYRQGKKYQESLRYYSQALEIRSVPGSIKAAAFLSIADAYADLYQSDLASINYSRAISQARTAKDIAIQELALAGLAELHYQQGEIQQASNCLTQARQLSGRLENNDAEPRLLNLAGRIAQEKGMAREARAAFEEALSIYQKSGNEDGQVKVLCSISSLDLFSDQKQQALARAEQALDIAERQAAQSVTYAEKMGAKELRWRAWFSQARAQRALGQGEAAVKSFKNAITHIEAIYFSVHVSSEATAVAFREECQPLYREFVDLLVEQGKFEDAYEWAQHARGRATRGVIEARRTAEPPQKSVPDAALRELSLSLARLRSELASSQISAEQQTKLLNDISDIESKMKEAQLRAEMGRPERRVRWSESPTVKQLQEKLAEERRVMVQFLLGDDRSFAWLISSNDISVEHLPGRKKIEKAVNEFVKLMTVAPNNMFVERDVSRIKERAAALFSTLFGRLSEQLVPGAKLVVVPDGILHYLPFEALVNNGRFLVEDLEISYLPSAGLLGQGSGVRAETGDKMELLAFGDPSFGPTPKAADLVGGRGRPGRLARLVRASRGFQLDSLPRTRDEVNYIASLFPAGRRQVYLGKESTERAVKQAPLSQYRRLHFATHSLVDEKSPSRSAVVLSLNNDPEEDGFLEVSEISELYLDCDLVVLSACQTGRGQLLSGEGILGLSRAFLAAGSKSVVVSLWNVSDVSTSQLMKSFYQHLLTNVGNAAALREAKLKMVRSNRETRHPYYWAPFIVVGKP